jgi:hypothetical protein
VTADPDGGEATVEAGTIGATGVPRDGTEVVEEMP